MFFCGFSFFTLKELRYFFEIQGEVGMFFSKNRINIKKHSFLDAVKMKEGSKKDFSEKTEKKLLLMLIDRLYHGK